MKLFNLIIILTLLSISATYSEDELIRAMNDELSRSMKDLKMEQLNSPYYIQYELNISKPLTMSASLGGIYSKSNNKNATLNVVCKVGNYKFDNTNFISGGFIIFGGGGRDDEERFSSRNIPPDVNYTQLRRELWLATDAAYKKAAEEYSQKEAVVKNRLRKDTTWDFTQVAPARTKLFEVPESANEKKIEAMLEVVSAIFKEYKDIFTSKVSFEYLPETIYFVNSEKMEYIKSSHKFGFEISATTQSSDGMSIYDFYTCYGTSISQLPSLDSLVKAAHQVAKNLVAMKTAKTLDEDYSGPVIFSNQAAGQIFAQIFAPNLITRREKVSAAGFPFNDNFKSFQTKIGGRVLPEFISLIDLPKQKASGNTPLFGFYIIDDDGIEAQDVVLVDKGYLKTLLSGRVPTKRIKASNGHFRNGSPAIGNLFVNVAPKNELSTAQLQAKMLKMCKDRDLEYGIIVNKISDYNIFTTSLFEQLFSGDYSFLPGGNSLVICEAYKVYKDGRMELIRGATINGLTAQSFKDIVFTSKNKNVINLWTTGQGSGNWIDASIVTPDLLFEDAEVKNIDKDFKKPPILENPISKK